MGVLITLSLVANLDSMQELMEAARWGSAGTVMVLIQQGANVNLTDKVVRKFEELCGKRDTCFICQRSN